MSEHDRSHSESYHEHEDLSELVDTTGFNNLEPNTLLDQEGLSVLRNQLFERNTALLQRHPDAHITSSEYSGTITGELSLARQNNESLFTQFHLEPYVQLILTVQELDGMPTTVLEAIEPDGACHSIGVGTTHELEVETMDVESGETVEHQPMVADAMFMQDILGAFEATLPMRSSHQDSPL